MNVGLGTPIKQRECDRDFCLVCGNFAKEARRVETIRKLKGKDYSLKDLLKKYGGINVESGTVCRKCSKKVDSLHKKNTDFYNECQKNAGMSKRMASSPHINPPKRINMSTPKTSTQYAAVFSDSEEEEDDISIIGLHLSDEDTETDQAHVSGILSLQSASSLSGSSSHPFSLDSLTSSATSDSATSFQTASMTSLASSNSVTSNQTGSCSTSTDHIYSKNNEKSSTVKSKGKEDKQRSTIPAAIDHDYIVSKPSPVVQNVMVDKIMDFKNNIDINSKTEMKEADTEILISILKTKNKREVIKHLLTTEGFKDSILCLLMEEINLMSNRLRNRKLFYVSELMKKRPEDLKFFKWNEIICEFMVKFPTVFSLILTMFLTPQDMENKDKIEAIIPRIGMVYSMLMQGRNKELSRIQRITSLFLFDNICDQKVFDRLQTVGVCLSYERSLQIVEMIGGHFNDKVVQLVKDNTRFRIIGDNINWTVGVHDQRINNKQKMMHAFGSAVIVQNLTFTNLDRVVPQQLYSQTPVQNFIPSEEDYNLITTDYIILMSRVVFEHIPYFKKFSDIVPIDISTPCSPNLKKSQKSYYYLFCSKMSNTIKMS